MCISALHGITYRSRSTYWVPGYLYAEFTSSWDKGRFPPGPFLSQMRYLGAFSLLSLFSSRGIAAIGSSVPHTITLTSRARVAPPGTSLKRSELDPVNVPLADFFLGTDLQ